ncbi:MAG: UDP-N-acetylmuramoyl-tripeptide--D-alanyl-D-alanine ligase [Candidatus Aldehydirespiratoraceae bacterium]|jgi:UDP-N-acetylmuramoyl-tripeptide--D-alanyl-D-alanine ligase
MRWFAAEIADVVGGVVSQGEPSTVVTWVTQDSREIAEHPDRASSLFVPLLAERDGHDFVVTSGAAVTLSSRAAADLGDIDSPLVVIEVDDTARALTELGAAARARLDGQIVVGITGSVGKTTTKDLLASIFAADRPTHASVRSFNNEIGVPLTILRAPDATEALVLEMGARGIGHIAYLCSIGRPTIGIVTTVGLAHTSEFGSVEGVAQAKGELVESLPPAVDGGIAVLNADNPLVAAMASRTSARVVTFGTGPVAPGDHVSARDITLDDELVPSFRIESPWGSADVVLGARGIHLVDNALGAAAAALASGVPMEAVIIGLATPVISPMRMSLVRTDRGTRILDDSYNANPMSAEAALRSLAALPVTEGSGGRRIAVLGEMAELGEISAAEHARIAKVAADLGIYLISVGASDYDADAQASDIPEALRLLAAPSLGAPIGPDDALLVKGSRVAGLERLVALLLA